MQRFFGVKLMVTSMYVFIVVDNNENQNFSHENYVTYYFAYK